MLNALVLVIGRALVGVAEDGNLASAMLEHERDVLRKAEEMIAMVVLVCEGQRLHVKRSTRI